MCFKIAAGQEARGDGETIFCGFAASDSGGYRQPLLMPVQEAIARRLAAKSDWTVRALASDLQAEGIVVSHDMVWRSPLAVTRPKSLLNCK
jgi:hypothetical protein